MTYCKPFFALQVGFARKASQLTGDPLDKALLDYTNLYARFGLGRGFDAANPVWQEFVAGIGHAGADDVDAWAYRFYQSRLPEIEPPQVVSRIGCFSYARLSADHIRLHFRNDSGEGDGDGDENSPLSIDRRRYRLDELRRLFALVRAQEHPASSVIGMSWLYNLPAYRSLFPSAYIASSTRAAPAFRAMPLWGQFVDRKGQLRAGVAADFARLLAAVQTITQLEACFPLGALRLEAPVGVFHEHYST
ncbi:MAG: hypothetical protein JWQ11_1451 [Rhizobacter sp.]|nr:hypothetical protein [Rhizobacter sp.]